MGKKKKKLVSGASRNKDKQIYFGSARAGETEEREEAEMMINAEMLLERVKTLDKEMNELMEKAPRDEDGKILGGTQEVIRFNQINLAIARATDILQNAIDEERGKGL